MLISLLTHSLDYSEEEMLLDPELDAATHETLRSCGGEGPYPGGNGESGWLAWCEKRSHTGWGGTKVRGGRRG